MLKKTPLYFQITESIREQIISGKLKYGQKLPSQRNLAKEYGVSLITVKRAILELVRDGLLVGHPGKGVFVGNPAHAVEPITRDSNTSVGVIITDLTSPFYSAVLREFELEAAKKGYFVIFSNTDRDIPNEAQQIQRLQSAGVKGFVVASRQHEMELQPHLRALLEKNVPLVFVSYCDDPCVNYIGTDHRMGGYLATRHLLDLGYRRIAYATPSRKSRLSIFRYRGYSEAMLEHGLSGDDLQIILPAEPSNGNRFEMGYLIGQELVREGQLPEAIFAFSDLTALGLKRAFLENQLRVPDDIALVGFDDIPMAAQSIIPLTTIRQPMDQIGQLALDTLVRKINGDRSVTRIALMPELIVRQSCGAKNVEKKEGHLC